MENKHDKFVRLAEKRTIAVLEALRILGNCSNRSSYDYGGGEIEKIFKEIEKQMRSTKAKFTATTQRKFKL